MKPRALSTSERRLPIRPAAPRLSTPEIRPAAAARGSRSDASHPSWRARSLSVYRFWRDLGYAIGALSAGIMTDLFGAVSAIAAIGALTFAFGAVVAISMVECRKAT